MRVLLSTYGSRGDVEPMAGLAVRLRALGAEVRVCAPPDKEFEERLAGAGVPLVPVGRPVRPMVTGRRRRRRGLPRRAAEFGRRAVRHRSGPRDPTRERPPWPRAVRTDGATVAATLLADVVGRDRPPLPA